jgi:hypothetical protein
MSQVCEGENNVKSAIKPAMLLFKKSLKEAQTFVTTTKDPSPAGFSQLGVGVVVYVGVGVGEGHGPLVNEYGKRPILF